MRVTGREAAQKANRERIENELMFRRITLDKRTDKKRLVRRLHIERIEALEEEKLLRAQEAKQIKLRQAELTEKLAKELLRRKNEEIQQESVCPIKIVKRSPPDCTLIDTRNKLIEDEIHFEAKQLDLIEKWYKDKGNDLREQTEEKEKKRNFYRDLRTQLTQNRLKSEREKVEDKQLEQKLIMEAQPEESAKLDDKEKKKEQHKRLHIEVKSLLENKRILSGKQKELEKEEQRKLDQINAEKEEERRKRKTQRAVVSAGKEALMERISKNLLEEDCKKREREQIVNESLLQEQRNELMNEPKKMALKKKCTRQKLLEAMALQEEIVADKKTKEKLFNDEFDRHVAEVRQKIEDAEVRKQSARRKRNLQYGEDLRNAILDNRVNYALKILSRQAKIKEQAEYKKQTTCPPIGICGDIDEKAKCAQNR